jgi:response regulator RpfG family c-di-GMP phosphodiesterase
MGIMRIKILLLGDDPISLMTDGLLLRERGLMVYTAFNLDNMDDLIREVKPDLVFFDPHQSNNKLTDAYNSLIGSIYYTHIPVIYTLSEDDVYLVTRKRTMAKAKRNSIADNIIDAVKMALHSNNHYAKNPHPKKSNKVPLPVSIASSARA